MAGVALPAGGMSAEDAALDALNTKFAERVCEDGAFFMTRTDVRGRTDLRACFLHYVNSEREVPDLLAAIRRAAEPPNEDEHRPAR